MRSSERSAFLEACEEHATPLFRHAYFRVSDRDRALDLTQETFFRAWNHLSEGGGIRQYKNFLYRVLHNLIIDEYRRKQHISLDALLENATTAAAFELLLSEGSVESAEADIDQHRLVACIHAAFEQLPEQYRVVLTMRFIDDLSSREIGEVIGLSENAVAVRLSRGVARLRVMALA